MRSMTGYGRASAIHENFQISVEVRSVNRKNLDAVVTMPREWQVLEGRILSALKERVERGRVVILVQAQPASERDEEAFESASIANLVEEFRTLSESLNAPFTVTPDLLLQLALYAKKNQSLPDPEEVEGSLLDAFQRALAFMVEMRESEGLKLAADLKARAEDLEELIAAIEGYADGTVARYRELLLQRLRQGALHLDPDDERVLKEIALFADRCDITEEITRLKSHLDQLSQFLESEGPVGRRTDFLLQEMNREINTIGSKSNDIRISRQVIAFKNEQERLREQVANIE